VTDPRRAVVLRYAKRRLVLSPDAPEDFIRDLAVPRGDTQRKGAK
jgi:hypothetical protein